MMKGRKEGIPGPLVAARNSNATLAAIGEYVGARLLGGGAQ